MNHGTTKSRSKNLLKLPLIGAVSALLILGASAGTASAATPPALDQAAATCTEVASVSAGPNGSDTQTVCGTEVGVSLGTPTTVGVADIQADPSLSLAQKAELVPLAAAGGIQANRWSQFTTGGAYTRTQNGQFYYNGSQVWVTQTLYGYRGSQSCFTNYAAGVTLTDKRCEDQGGDNSQRTMFSEWNVSVAVLGQQVYSYDISMNAQLYPNGTIQGFGGTVG